MTTYGEVKRIVLELINQYSAAGETISPPYNNQSDYLHRIPNLLNLALMELRTAAKPRRAVYLLPMGEGEPLGTGTGWYTWPMPRECRRILSGGGKYLTGDGPKPVRRYQILGGDTLALPAGEGEYQGREILVEYERYPEQLPADPADEYELDEDPELIQAACFYAAAGLALTEDEYVSAVLRREYETRFNFLRPSVTAEYVKVADGTGGDFDGGGQSGGAV